MITTSAWGMGINDGNVERVIQWQVKHLDNLDTLVQRFGRCACRIDLQGICLLFTEKAFIGKKSLANQRPNPERTSRTTAEER